MNGLIVVSVVINGLLALVLGASGEYPQGLSIAMGISVLVSVGGAVLIATGARKPGAILVMIGCALFVPIGLIGVIGGRRVLDELKREAFNAEV